MPRIPIEKVVEICTQFEQILRPIGFHVGLTGSCLYGGGEGKDMDCIIYPHIKEDGSFSKMQPEAVLKTLGMSDIRNTYDSEYEFSEDYIYIAKHPEGMRIDFFFLVPS